MIRTAFAIAVAASVLAAVPEVSQAAPIAPLPAGMAHEAAAGNLIQAWCGWRCRHYYRWHYWHHCYWRYGYRHCW